MVIYIGVPLSLATLMLIKWKDERGNVRTFRLVNRVSSQWREKFGTLLNIDSDQLEAWNNEFMGNAMKCWHQVMDHWLAGRCACSPEHSATWGGLLTLLEDAEFFQVARDLENALSSVIPPSHPTPLDTNEIPGVPLATRLSIQFLAFLRQHGWVRFRF